MTRSSNLAATLSQNEADQAIQRFYGASSREELDASQAPSFPRYAVDLAVKIVDGTIGGANLAEMHAEWAQLEAESRGAGGKRPSISTRSMLVILLMHAIANEAMSIRHMASTLTLRLTAADRASIGLSPEDRDGQAWYYRVTAAHGALLAPIDPYPMPRYSRNSVDGPTAVDRINRHRRLTGKQRIELARFHESISSVCDERRERLDELMFQLIANVVRHAQATGMLEGFTGNIALDATYTAVQGKTSSKDLSHPARSTNLEAGAWRRGGDHGDDTPSQGPDTPQIAKRRAKFRFGFETEVVTMTAGEVNVPELILGVNLHQPGAISGVASALFPRIATLQLPVDTISVDRAYNNLTPGNFHEVLLSCGYEFVFDYPKDELGTQASFHSEGVGYLMVEGSWYLGFMPEALIDCVRRANLPSDHEDFIDRETLQEQLEAREDYRLVRHGRRDKEGFQRYRLPDPKRYMAFDPLTGEILQKPRAKTVTIPMSIGLRWAQRHPYMSPEWHKAYNLRSAVERKNSQLKHTKFEDLDNPLKRPRRGHAANSLAVAMMAVAHNLRTIDNHLRTAEGIDTTKSPHRRKRRRNKAEILTRVSKPRDGRSRA